ncbi:MAG: alpha/beta hydrolase-fold protein, partial [Pseudomonadota bacterium]
MAQATTELHDLDSKVMGANVPMSVVLPPDFQRGEELPLLINLHGGGGDRTFMTASLPIWQALWDSGDIPPLVMVSFSSGPGSWYGGAWEEFVVDELPQWAHEKYGASLEPAKTVMTGISMGGYGSLKIGFKHPNRFRAIAPMEPAIEPSLERMPNFQRNTWYRMPPMEEAVWGSPVDEAAWLADNPATLADHNADVIRASGMEIYLEVGDKDYINLHDGAEFMHRVLWDRDIRHEYHLVRWADHVGVSMARRIAEAHRFLAAALAGGLEEPIDLPLNEEEQAYLNWVNSGAMATGEPPPSEDFNMMADPVRAPSIHRHIWDPLRD